LVDSFQKAVVITFKCESRVKISESLRTLRKPLRSLRLSKSLTAKNAKKRLYLSTFISTLDSHFK
jgi:hypothetical protein